jgi:hypothetical protein
MQESNMTTERLPWAVHRIGSIYHHGVQTLNKRGWVRAVAEPYSGGRLKAAWWVLTGRAYAFRWPKPGELETALRDPNVTMGMSENGVG